MRKGWEMKKLGDVLVKTNTVDPTKNPDLEFIYLDVASVNKETKEIENAVSILGKDAPSRARKLIKVNDIIFATVRPTHGRVAIITKEYDNQVCSTGYFVLRGKEFIFNSYLYYFLLTTEFNKQMEVLQKGASYLAVTDAEVRNIPIPIPPLPEQQRIVAYLDTTFANLNQAKANLQKNLQNAKELFETELRNVFENKGDGWEEKSLGDVLIKTETIDPTKKPDEEFIYLDVSSVNKETKEIENSVSLLGRDAPSRARKLIKENDIIFATVRPTHNRVAIITEEYNNQVCSTGYYVLRPKSILKYKFLYYYLRTNEFNNQMEILQKGASYPAVNDNDVKVQIINFPKSLQTQQEIVSKLDALKTQTQALENLYQTKLNNLEELRSGILKRAFEGQID